MNTNTTTNHPNNHTGKRASTTQGKDAANAKRQQVPPRDSDMTDAEAEDLIKTGNHRPDDHQADATSPNGSPAPDNGANAAAAASSVTPRPADPPAAKQLPFIREATGSVNHLYHTVGTTGYFSYVVARNATSHYADTVILLDPPTATDSAWANPDTMCEHIGTQLGFKIHGLHCPEDAPAAGRV